MRTREMIDALVEKDSKRFDRKHLESLPAAAVGVVYKCVFGEPKVLPNNKDYDSQGNEVTYEMKEADDTEIVEPYDPEYLEENPQRDEVLSTYEKWYLKEVAKIEKALRQVRVAFDWDDRFDTFRVARYPRGEYPVYRYIWIEEDNTYAFGPAESMESGHDTVTTPRLSVLVRKVKTWTETKLIKKDENHD